MNLIYIDANIYLGFYNTNRPEYKKLLNSLIELEKKIFFTEQIANEIDRNKLNIFKQSIENYTRQVSLSATKLPEHLDDTGNTKLTDWNKQRLVLESQINASNKDLAPILDDVLHDIAISKDKISQDLNIIYQNAVKANKKEFEDAQKRREIGNPPGKRTDPLGDQLSWEQLLSIIPKIKKLWIISNDRDYFTEYKKKLYLNPILHKDLQLINPNLEIKTYNVLSEALRDYDKQEKISAIPKKEELDIISKVESLDLTGFTSGSTASYIFSSESSPSLKPQACPNCGSNSFSNGSYLRSQYSGLTFQYICTNCGFHYDTGEFMD
ncbi:PIN domain-containing protein [Flavobacterium sp. 2]|uniref:PIN-like domain-containing protein n=1 Tax=Flavobacterium sp. 2 TaxID=308053 RepID=UPI000C193BC2|nr:PIN domain-containing protein [Flavobacterium sp. 2]PIF59815.1 hypothetical protein CLU99_3049 [Flavobacterium sp. 2]